MELTLGTAATAFVLCAFWLAKFVRSTYFHPLSHVPGPWWAGSYLGEFYFDVIKGGQFFKKVEELHKIHGSKAAIVRSEQKD